ncbi:helix-turn-helix domain-containing protein [Reyranella sp.]|uniref:helix-turn-helix domain-containing protein n=1 Tax=Reyranella sp. TaxID=1929291 RepID=UPI003D0FE65F
MRGRTPAEPIKNFPNRLREWREARGLSLKQLAELTNQKHQSVQRHEIGENQMTMVQMELYARKLKIKPEELFNHSQRIDPQLRELAEVFDRLPGTERQRLLRLAHAFADPPAPFAAEPPAPQRATRRR